ncbi:MAG TPA: hypothetical protein ENI27_08325 [bacterium]|nr:hypothetical protein [bacterium]
MKPQKRYWVPIAMKPQKRYWVPPIIGESIQDVAKPEPVRLSRPWHLYMAFIITAALTALVLYQLIQ